MATEVILPRVDMEMTSGKVTQWFAEDGATVEKGAPLFEIETDKAAMEIEAPASGTLRLGATAQGADVPVGVAIAWIVAPGEVFSLPGAVAAKPAAPEVPMLRATPLARREAAERGLDLAAVAGSGPRGRVCRADVLAIARDTAPAAVTASAFVAPPAPPPSPSAPLPAPPPPGAPARSGLYLERFGPRAGTPIVLLHGFGSELGNWREIWRLLEPAHPVVALDLPGHGRSPAAGTSLPELVDAVRARLDEEGIERLHLVGHSLGGAVALALAETHPGVRSLGLIAPAGLGPEIDAAFLAGFIAAEQPDSLAPWLRRLFADPAMASDGLVRATLRAQAAPGRREQQRALVACLFPDGTQALSLRPLLQGLAMPAKLIWGQADAIIPARQARGVAPQVGVHLLPGIGHVPQLEAPALIARLLRELAAAGG